MDKQREAFEAWAKEPPREFYLARHPDAAAWPGNYKDYHVECAWQAWQATQQAKWLPIETAPRDETPVLAYAKSVFGVVDISEMFFVDGNWYWFRDGEMPDAQPTHWMPLPPEPQL